VATPRAGGACQPENNPWRLGGLILKKKTALKNLIFFFCFQLFSEQKFESKNGAAEPALMAGWWRQNGT